MKTKAVSKYNRTSARKARLVADMVRGQKASAAFDILKFTPKKAAKLIEKTLKSAVANAENNFGADRKDLVISAIMVDEGPTLKRHRPRSKGMANPIRKRTSHVTIVVEGKEKSLSAKPSEKVSQAKKTEKTGNDKSKKLTKKTASKAVNSENGNGA